MHQRIFDQYIRVRSVSTDTRKINPGSIFFALRGANFNANEFAGTALEMGASMAVVDEDHHVNDDRIIRVPDVLKALQELAHAYRKTLDIPFLAITGSNGKTTTKELVRDVLKKKFRVTATIGNLNNHIGVPLTILSIPEDCELAVIEMGANHQGEIKSYCEYAEPDFALVTNIGKAHLEGFGGVEGVKKGKKELYDYVDEHGGRSFVNTELDNLREVSAGMNIIPYGFQSPDFQLELINESPTLFYKIKYADGHAEVKTQLAGSYNMYNIASAVAVGLHFGVSREKINQAIAEYTPDNNRSQLKKTEYNTLIMDAYNANPSSMEHALVSLSRQDEANKFFIIGDMRELGPEGVQEHRNILQKAEELGLHGITVGPIFQEVGIDFPFPTFATNDEAIWHFREQPLKGHIVLIKGSRGIHLEDVVSAL